MKRIINCETGEVIDRELNDDELKQEKIDWANSKKLQKEAEEKEAARQAIADRIGLSADELKLLFG
jgi:hypothetical protein